MKCPNCGNEAALGQGFCNLCGTRLQPDDSRQEPPAAAAPARSGGSPVVPIVISIVVVVAILLLVVCCLCLAFVGLTGLCAVPVALTRVEPTRIVVVRRTQQPAQTRVVEATARPRATRTPAPTQVPRVTVSVWYVWTSPQEQAVLQDMVSVYTRDHPNVTLDIVQVPSNELDPRFQTAAAAGRAPTLLIASHERIDDLADKGLIRPLDDLAPADLMAQMNPASVEAGTYNGRLYAMPLLNTCVALYYNKNLLGDREPPRTVDEMLALAKDVAPRNGYGLVWNSQFFWNSGYLGAFGAQLFDDDYKCILDQGSGAVDFLTFVKTMKDTQGVLVHDDIGNTITLFESGKAAMINDGSWMLSNYQEKLGKSKVGVTVLPAAKYPAAPFLSVESIYISASATEEEAVAAMSFVTYLLTPEQSQRFAEHFNRVPANIAVDLHADPARMGFMEQIKTAVPIPVAPEMGAVWEPMDDMIDAVLNGTSTPEKAVTEAAKRINEINKK